LYRKNLNYRFKFLSFLRKIGIDIALGSVIASSVNCDILRYSGAKERWGYLRSPTLRNKINYRGIKSVNSARNLADGKFVSTLTHEAALVSAAFPKIKVPDIIPPKIVNMPGKPKGLQNKYIVYLPEAGNMRRCCPQKKLLPVLTDIADNLTVVVLGNREFEFENEKIVNLTGKTSLKEAISIVSNASAVIGNETGLSHIAYLAGVPTAIVLGGGHWGRFLPIEGKNPFIITNTLNCFCCDWKCRYSDTTFKCVDLESSVIHSKLSQWKKESWGNGMREQASINF
jgi:ADP-heptose:LPS heptosyltransferase